VAYAALVASSRTGRGWLATLRGRPHGA